MRSIPLIERIIRLEKLVFKKEQVIKEGSRARVGRVLYRNYKDPELYPFSSVKINPPEPEDIKWSTFPGESWRIDDGTERERFQKLSTSEKLKFLVLWFKVNFQLNFKIKSRVILLSIEEYNKIKVKRLSSMIERGLNSFNAYFDVNFRFDFFTIDDENEETSDERYLYKMYLVPGKHNNANHYFEI